MKPRTAFFIEDLTEQALSLMDVETRQAAEEFKQQCEDGPGDGSIDIEWQESCKGYYAHLEVLDQLKQISPKDYQTYRNRLVKEIKEIESLDPSSSLFYMASIVKRQIVAP